MTDKIKKALLDRAAENAFQNKDPKLANALYDEVEKTAGDSKKVMEAYAKAVKYSKKLKLKANENTGKHSRELKKKFPDISDYQADALVRRRADDQGLQVHSDGRMS